MRVAAIAFLAGVCLVQTRPAVDVCVVFGAVTLCVALALRIALACVGRWRAPSRRIVAGALTAVMAFGAAVALTAWRVELRLADALRGELEGVDQVVHGRIASLPQPLEDGWRFVLEPESAPEGVPRRVLLSWRDRAGAELAASVMPQPGERWSFGVRLRRPHGFVNPGGFDYEAWLLERGIRATGYVRGQAIRLDGGPGTPIERVHRLRASVRQRLLAASPEGGHGGLMVALAVGDQGGIAPSDWEVFRRTGVGHLVSISGLHVALVGLFCGGLVSVLWRRLPALALRLPAQKAAAIAALVAASAYALLAGLGIPVVRAWLMLVVAVWVMLSGRAVAPSRALAIALLVVLVADPWAVLSAGFWLSFGAVAVILASVGGRVRAHTGWQGAVRIQLVISVALIPLLLAQFQSFPIVSPLANLVAIPLVSFVITPLVLLALPWPHALLLAPADVAAGWMMAALRWLATWDRSLWEQAAPPSWLLAAGLVAVALLLLPRATPGRLAAPVVLAALLAWEPVRPPPGGFEVQVLDVGQGLAVHVRTRTHDLLYDAGPPYGAEADAGSRVILPYLRAVGARRIDRLVLSHGDVDHVGGAISVFRGMPVAEVLSGQPAALEAAAEADPRAALAVRQRPCAGEVPWTWDGVRFEILHPPLGPPPDRSHDNDTSCVLRVSGPAGALLLTGDISRAGEGALIARLAGGSLHSEVVVSAHHGSRSSSSQAFVDATLPAHVVHSAGHHNAFGHPHPQIWARWTDAGARNWRTDAQGAIGIVFAADADDGVTVHAAREYAPRYWHGR